MLDLQIKPFDPATARPTEWAALNFVQNRLDDEFFRGEPEAAIAFTRADWSSVPPEEARHAWLAYDQASGDPLGLAVLYDQNTEENQHMGWLDLYVLPARRRQGIGRRLLAAIAAAAEARQRRLIIGWSAETLPGGPELLTRIGARPGLAGHMNQLRLADVDPALLECWAAQAAERAADLELRYLTGPYPEDEIEGFAVLAEAMNTAPRGDLEIEDEHKTAAQLRAREAQLAARGDERWAVYVRDPATGAPVAVTLVVWNPGKPHVVEQWGTMVLPAYRNRGLGRWIKAAMLQRILRERPQATVIRTGNADVNAPMLNINHALGFRPLVAWSNWQMETAQLAAYLARATTPALAG